MFILRYSQFTVLPLRRTWVTKGWLAKAPIATSTTADLHRKEQPMNPKMIPKNSLPTTTTTFASTTEPTSFTAPTMAAEKEKAKVAYNLRQATPSDVNDIYRFVMGQLYYENSLKSTGSKAKKNKENHSKIDLTKADLLRDGFGPQPLFQCFLAEVQNEGEKTPKAVGMALYYFTYSTWQGRVLYLEDIFIDEEYRRYGIGSAFFRRLAEEAKKTNCARFQWSVLKDNKPTIAFYKKIGAREISEYLTMRMYKTDIDSFLESSPSTNNKAEEEEGM